jgi:hypothetical protein
MSKLRQIFLSVFVSVSSLYCVFLADSSNKYYAKAFGEDGDFRYMDISNRQMTVIVAICAFNIMLLLFNRVVVMRVESSESSLASTKTLTNSEEQ